MHLLVGKERLQEARDVICRSFNYHHAQVDECEHWWDWKCDDPQGPYAFNLNDDTLLLVLQTGDELLPPSIYLHADSVFHFNVHDLSRTCLNPDPPSDDLANVHFPTLEAFYDSLIDTQLCPPRGFMHNCLDVTLMRYFGELNDYTTSVGGRTWSRSGNKKPPMKREILPPCLDVIRRVRFDNRPSLIRRFVLARSMNLPTRCMERHELRKLKDPRYNALEPMYPDDPTARHWGLSRKPQLPGRYLTPFLMRQESSRKVVVEWHSLARLTSQILHRIVF